MGAMEGSSAAVSNSNPISGGATPYLSNLPSRGLFSSTVFTSNPCGMRVYICDHDTSPSEEQLIKTNQTNILIRSLTLKKQKEKQKVDASAKDVKGVATPERSRSKRVAERPPSDGRAAKRPVTSSPPSGSRQEGSSRASDNFQSLTVERLRAILKEKGLSLRGKKDELVARLKGVSG